MEIDGWCVRLNRDGGLLRDVPGNPNLYQITIINRYAIDIELVRSVVDSFPIENKQEMLIKIIKESIEKAPKLPWEEHGNHTST